MFVCISAPSSCVIGCDSTNINEFLCFPQVHGGGGYDSDFSDEDVQAESSERGLKR